MKYTSPQIYITPGTMTGFHPFDVFRGKKKRNELQQMREERRARRGSDIEDAWAHPTIEEQAPEYLALLRLQQEAAAMQPQVAAPAPNNTPLLIVGAAVVLGGIVILAKR